MSLMSLIYARIALNGDENDLTKSMKPFVHPEVKVIYEDFLLPPSSYELPDNGKFQYNILKIKKWLF